MEIYNNIEPLQQLKDIIKDTNRKTVLKSLLATAVIIASIAACVLLTSDFLAVGIGIILVSSFAIYQLYINYRNTNNLLKTAISATSTSSIPQTIPFLGTSARKFLIALP